MAERYRVCVRGHLDERWSGWFDGLTVHRESDGTTALVGPLGDQAALHGVLERIRDLGMSLLSVNPDTGEIPGISAEPHDEMLDQPKGGDR